MITTVIFDLNGVIADTQKWHSRIESVMLNERGVSISHTEITKHYASMRAKDIFTKIFSDHDIDVNIDSLMEEKWFHVYDFFKNNFEVVDGVVDLVKSLHNQGYSLAVSSSSKISYVRDVLNKIGIREYFDFLVGGDMVENGKPHPESFLFAASCVDSEPEHCVVIEDGVKGMRAAKDAGMKCIGLKNNLVVDYPADYVVSSLSEIHHEFIQSIDNN